MEKVWADSFVEESNLTFTIRQLRKALGDTKQNPQFVETVQRRGYRFIAKVKEVLSDDISAERQASAKTSFKENLFPSDWHSRPVLFSISGVIILFLLTTSFFVWRGNGSKARILKEMENTELKFETITSSDKPIAAVISPDGKYVAYVNIASNQRSLWLRQLSSGINTPIVAPTNDVNFGNVEFSPDGEYIYFTSGYKNEPMQLNRVSIFGGAVKTNILSGLDGAFSISPDSQSVSFRRYEPRKHSLLIANIDGSDTRSIFETPKTFTDNIFSPDGKTIAFASGQSDTGERDFGVYAIDVESGNVKPVTDFKWFHVRGVLWLPDQSGLLVTARIKNDEPQQLWKISLPGGEVKKITDTQNDFSSISATADLSQILLTQISRSSNLYLASPAAPNNLQSLAQASGGVVWTAEGDLVYSSASNGNNDIWLLNADKINQKQLTTEDSADFNPQVSPDGRYIVFVSDRGGKNNLWRMNADGGNVVRLTSGAGESGAVFIPDTPFVVYNSAKDGSLWKISVEGGEAMQISNKPAYNISISPDGMRFAHFVKKDERVKILVKSFAARDVVSEYALPEGFSAGRKIVWIKNGEALIYSAEDNSNVGNLWEQNLNHDPPQKLSNYTSDEIFSFNYSPDELQLALIRGSWHHDVVLVREFK